jgi:PAS domain S-box-containing protein
MPKTGDKLLLASEVLENVQSGIVVVDRQGVIGLVNTAFTDITGYGKDEVVGYNFNCFADQDAFGLDGVLPVLAEAPNLRGQAWRRRKDGAAYLEGYVFTAIRDGRGQIDYLVKNFRDITEQEKIEKERELLIEQKTRLRRLASLSAMSAGAVHEIAQPLNSIKVLADGALYWHRKGVFLKQEELVASLESISEQADKINEIIKHMRSFANIGRVDQHLPCNLNIAINTTMEMLNRQLSSHGISVKKMLADDLPEAWGTHSGFEEVILNLLVNAMQALDGVDKQGKEIEIRTYASGGKITLEISDNATGINEAVNASIFEPLFSTKIAGEGMGLGLFIVQTILSGFEGQIEAYNNSKGGATFRAELPERALVHALETK